jgi:hypothetical protein
MECIYIAEQDTGNGDPVKTFGVIHFNPFSKGEFVEMFMSRVAEAV